jgi:hypothetical protein
MNVDFARAAHRQQRTIATIATNDRIRALALTGASLDQIRAEVGRGPNYIRRIAGWRLK